MQTTAADSELSKFKSNWAIPWFEFVSCKMKKRKNLIFSLEKVFKLNIFSLFQLTESICCIETAKNKAPEVIVASKNPLSMSTRSSKYLKIKKNHRKHNKNSKINCSFCSLTQKYRYEIELYHVIASSVGFYRYFYHQSMSIYLISRKLTQNLGKMQASTHKFQQKIEWSPLTRTNTSWHICNFDSNTKNNHKVYVCRMECWKMILICLLSVNVDVQK